ncbi:MAG TPA: BglG family transcription antiterminator, partial [Clostridium sp.]
ELDELAELVGVSTRTIRNYLKDINKIIMEDDIAEILQIKEMGYRIIVHDQVKYDEFIKKACLQSNSLTVLNTPEDRLMYIIQILIESKQVIKIDELACEINVGRTTLINDLKKIEALFKLYDIKIKGKQNLGIAIEGNELNIRLFILDYLSKNFVANSTSNSSLTMIHNEYYKKIKICLIDLFTTSKFQLLDETLIETLNYIMVMLTRVNDDKSIINLEEKYEDIIDSEEYNLSVKIMKMLVKITGYKFDQYEVAFITLPLIGRKASINFNNVVIKSSVKLLAEQIINEINENLGVSIEYDNVIVKNFTYHLNFMLNRLIFNIKNKNELIIDIKKSYPLPYEMAKIAAKVIENTYGLKSGEDEIAYMAIYFASYIEQDSYEGEIINKVALVCGTGLGSSQFLNIKLRKLLGKDLIIDNYSDMKLTKEILEQYDIVFTTVDITLNTETPIIMINVIFDDDVLKKTIQTKVNLKKYNANNLQANDPILSIVAKKEHFFLLEEDNYMDNLKFMIDKLFELGEVDMEFKNRIIERELKSNTLFGNYVALPHAVNNKVKPLLIAFGVLKKHTVWEGKEVKIIILLMIPSEQNIDKDLLIRTYEQLLKLAQNKQVIINMSKLKNYNEFKNILLKEILV